MSAAAQTFAERTLIESVGVAYRTVEKGSVSLDHYVLEWTQITKRGSVTRAAYVDRDTVLELLASHLSGAGA